MKARKAPLFQLHNQIVREKQVSTMICDEIARQRELIDNTIKSLVAELRDFALADIWCPSLKDIHIDKYVKTSIYDRAKRETVESLSNLPYSTIVTRLLNSFLRDIPNHYDSIAKCITHFFEKGSTSVPYNFCSNSYDFLGGSALPALFGYCWCLEQGIAYVDFICHLISLHFKSKGFNTASFRSCNYLKAVIRSFMHLTGVQKYLQLALSSPLYLFFYDEHLNTFDCNNPTKEYWEVLIGYVGQFISGLLISLPSFPPLLRYFLARVYNLVLDMSDHNQAVEIVRIIFLEFLIIYALVTPKRFGLLPETSANPESVHIGSLMQVTRASANESNIITSDKYKDIKNIPAFCMLKTRNFIEKLCRFDEEMDGVSLVSIQTITESCTHPIKISVNDCLYLATIIESTYQSLDLSQEEQSDLASLCRFAKDLNLLSNEPIDFWYLYYKVPKGSHTLPMDDFLSELSQSQNSPVKRTSDSLDLVIPRLLTYLENLAPSKSNSDSIFFLLENQRTHALDCGEPQWVIRTDSVLSKLEHLRDSEDAIIARLSAEVRARVTERTKRFSLFFMHRMIEERIAVQMHEVQLINSFLAPITNQIIVKRFLKINPDIKKAIANEAQSICRDPTSWCRFFVPLIDKLMDFVGTLGIDMRRRGELVRQLHSAVIMLLGPTFYNSDSTDIIQKNELVGQISQVCMAEFLSEKYSPILVQLFDSPACFDLFAALLRKGTQIGTPLERLAKITEVVDSLYAIYEFEANNSCSDEDFIPLLHYTLLRSQLPNLASLMNLISHFLLSVNRNVELLTAHENFVATTFITLSSRIIEKALEAKR